MAIVTFELDGETHYTDENSKAYERYLREQEQPVPAEKSVQTPPKPADKPDEKPVKVTGKLEA